MSQEIAFELSDEQPGADLVGPGTASPPGKLGRPISGPAEAGHIRAYRGVSIGVNDPLQLLSALGLPLSQPEQTGSGSDGPRAILRNAPNTLTSTLSRHAALLRDRAHAGRR
jgi:hypothetical protein